MDDEADEMKITLTSTMDNMPQNVLLSENNDKNDANDSTPTSSTDAASIYSTTSVNASEDPISSTSTDVSEKGKVIPKVVIPEDDMEIKCHNIGVSKSLIGSDCDVDLLDMANVSSEPINEDVEDIVQDLENLLGESEPTKDYLSLRKKHLIKDIPVESDLVALEQLVNEEDKADELTVELIQNEDANLESAVSQTSPKVFEKEQVLEKLNPNTTESKLEEHEGEIKQLQEQHKEDLQNIVSPSDNIENVLNTKVFQESEKKHELEELTTVVKGIEDEKVESGTNNDKINVVEVSVMSEDVDEIEESNSEHLKSTSTSLNLVKMATPQSEYIIEDSEIVSLSEDQPNVLNQDMSEITPFVSKLGTESVVFEEPLSIPVKDQSPEPSSPTREGKSELHENLISEHILPEISYSTEETTDIDEIVKLAVDDVIEDTTSTSLTNEILPEVKLVVLHEPASGVSILQDDKKDKENPEPQEFCGKGVQDIFKINSKPLVPVSGKEIGDATSSTSSDEDTIKIEKNIESVENEIDPIISLFPSQNSDTSIIHNSEHESGTEELKTRGLELSAGDPAVDKLETHLEEEYKITVDVGADKVTESEVCSDNINIDEEAVSTIGNVPEILIETEGEVHVQEEMNLVVEDKIEKITDDKVQITVDDKVEASKDDLKVLDNDAKSFSAEKNEAVFEIENEVVTDVETAFNFKDDLKDEINAENENEIVEVVTDSALKPECGSLVEDQSAVSIESKTEMVKDITEPMNAENENDIIKVVTGSVLEAECGSLVEDRSAVSIESKSELVKDVIDSDLEVECGSSVGDQSAVSDETKIELVKDITDFQLNVECGSEVEDQPAISAEDESQSIKDVMDSELNFEVEDKSAVGGEHESGLVIDVTKSQLEVECGYVVEDQSAQTIPELSQSYIHVETGCNDLQETECVENEPVIEDETQLCGYAPVIPDVLTPKDQGEIQSEDMIETVENKSEEVVQDVKFVEIETSSTTNDNPELVFPGGDVVELEEASKNIEKDATLQIMEEVLTASHTATTSPLDSNLEPVIQEPDISTESLQEAYTTEEEVSKLDSEKMFDENIEVPQVNEISSAHLEESNADKLETIKESSENIEKIEIPKVETTEDNGNEGEKSSERKELAPVVEEVIVKKTIIYEHDCKHKPAHQHENEEQKGKDKLKFLHSKNAEGGPKEAVESIEIELNMKDNLDQSSCSTKVVESVVSQEDESRVDLIEDNVPEVNKNIELEAVIEDSVGNNEKINMIDEVELKKSDLKETDLLDNHGVVAANQQKEDAETKTLIPNQSLDSSLCRDSSEKRIDQSSNNIHNAIHDQTTAAVQSILDNMLAEEQNVVLISNKEEPAVVHSSYSSYELQKAVQQIQDISKMDENEDLSTEPYVADIEKPREPVEIVQMVAESSEPTVEEYENRCIQSIEAESTSGLPEQNKSAYAFGLESSADLLIKGPQPGAKILLDVTTDAALLKESSCTEESDQEAVTQSSDKHVEIQNVPPNNNKIDIPLVEPSIDLSEESSNDAFSDSEHRQDMVSSTSISPDKFSVNIVDKVTEVGKLQRPLKPENIVECVSVKSDVKKSLSRETRHSSRIVERGKDKLHSMKENIIEPLTINIDEMEKEKNCSPKVIVKTKDDESTEDREEHKGSLKITITKQSDNTHSILKICSPDTELRHRVTDNDETGVVPKLVIKTSDTDLHSPKMSTRSSKQTLSANITQKSGSPRITIKPIPKPETKEPISSPLKITIKPMGKPEEFSKQQQQKHSPKVTKSKSEDDHYGTRSKILKLTDNSEVISHKVIIKPIVKPSEDCEQITTPKITIKPFDKPDCEAKTSPKITIKPVLRPVDVQSEIDEEYKERIVLKINKGTIPSKEIDKANRESRKREHEEDKSEKLAKIKLKFSKGGDAHIVHEENVERRSSPNKRMHDEEGFEKNKRHRCDNIDNNSDEDVKIVEDRQSPIVISEDSRSQDSVIVIEEGAETPPVIVKHPIPVPVAAVAHVPKKRGRPRKVPLVAREDFGNMAKDETLPVPSSTDVAQTVLLAQDAETSGRPKRSCRGQSVRDTLGMKPRKPKAPSKPRGAKRGSGLKTIGAKGKEGLKFGQGKLELIKKSLTEEALESAKVVSISEIVSKGLLEKILDRPDPKLERPIELKGLLEAAKDQNIIEIIEVDTPSSSPKHISCESQDVDTNDKILSEDNIDKDCDIPCSSNEVDSTRSDVDLVKDDVDSNRVLSELVVGDAVGSDVEMQPPTPVFAPPLSEASAMDISQSTDIAMFEEETRMSAEASSRAQTPAKQVVSVDVVVEESQSSVQSTATTESGKISRRSRLEVHQEADGTVVTADQLNEYYWGGNGPFMIQEQVAHFLGIKSFKRKYPAIPRRMVDMQERDYIRENGLASESMCDLGLTAVNSADILDIMYSDFQEKYEEYCKFQRDKQAKDLLNKQKAMSQAANIERNKLDLVEQAVHSAATYNTNFNRARKEHRRACMDLQTMNVHYPKGKLRQISLPKMGNYPVAVVPGQYTDYYKEFTPTELNNLPVNTMLYTELHKILPEVSDSDSDSSGSDSDDSSSSDSDSVSSCGENCKLCNTHDKRTAAPSRKSPIHASV